MNSSLYKSLNSAQKEAVDTIDGPVLVIAGPGTGKTQLIALRAAKILQTTDTSPQNILCLTYTEVGARNMRERLTSLVGQEAYDIRISTYHGFGSELIRQYGDYFNEYGADQPVDKIGQIKILTEIFDRLPATNPLWRPDVYLRDILSFISECKKALLMPCDIRDIANANQEYINNASIVIQKTIKPFPKINKEVAKYFIELLYNLKNIPASNILPEGVVPLGNLMMLDLANAVEFFNDTNKTNEITNFKKKWLDKDSNNNWIMYGQREVNKLLGAADIYEQYLLELSNKNLFDYDDMIYRAIKGLEQNDELRYSLHEQFLYIMLDEFQDTNRAQLKLVELLTNNPVLEGRPNVLAVGDDDQAIFSFQGAELSNMTRFVSIYKNTKIITLTDNYRSHSDILQTAHSVASSIEERLSNQLGKGNKQLDAKNTKLPKATIRRINFKSDIAQFDWVANQIEKQINNGTKPQEIAVLAPKHKHIEPLVAYLEAKSIPVRYEKRENILEDSKILEITSMAELVMAISNQNFALADSLWPTVLSADYWQLPTSLIWSLSWHSYDDKVMNNKTGHWQALMMQDPALKPISLFFAKLGQIQQHETLETMFDYLVGVTPLALNETDIKQYSSPYYEYYFSKQTQEHSPLEFTTILSNLTVLRQHLREYHNNDDTPLRLQDMLSFISDYRTAGEKLLNTSPYHSAINSVQLMTVYGAKGLEFETVYILATHDEVWGTKDKSPNSNIGLPPNLTYIRRAGSTKDEKKRIFFVALTRAKHTLYLTSYSFNFAGKTTNSLEFLNESDGKSLALPSHAQAITAEDSSVLAKDTLTHFWTTRHTQGANNTSLRDLVLPRLDTFQLSATHLNTFTDLVYGGPEVFFMNTVLKFPKAPTADGQFGNAIHETLESIQHTLRRTGELPDTDQTIDIFVTKLKAKKLSENEFERLKGRGTEALKKFLPWWWHNFIPQSQTEYSFRHEASFVSKAHLSGNLDQILIDPKTKQIRIIDFKTGKPQTKWQKDIKSHKYKQQLNFYKILVENSHSFKSYDVDEAKLVFIEPDTITGEMHELEIKYNKDELEKTRLLIKAVWNCIKNLDLPDTSNFKPDINGTIEFENWLIENKILK